jgi:hypothetical protein
VAPRSGRLDAGPDVVRPLLALDVVLGRAPRVGDRPDAQEADGHVGAETGQGHRGGGADAVVGAGDEGDAAVERERGHGRTS